MSETHRMTVDPNECGRDEILAHFPPLEAGDITASLEFAARLTALERGKSLIAVA